MTEYRGRPLVPTFEGLDKIEMEVLKWKTEPDYVNGERTREGRVEMGSTEVIKLTSKRLDEAYGIPNRVRKH